MCHLMRPISASCTHIKHYPEFGGADMVLEYQVMRQVKCFFAIISIIPQILDAFAQALHIP